MEENCNRMDKPREPKEDTLGDKTCQREMDTEMFELEKGKS